MTQIEEMRREFEVFVKERRRYWGHDLTKSPTGYCHAVTDAMFQSFQAAYTPRPSVEVVADAILNAMKTKDGTMRSLAQAAIDSIFNQNKENLCN